MNSPRINSLMFHCAAIRKRHAELAATGPSTVWGFACCTGMNKEEIAPPSDLLRGLRSKPNSQTDNRKARTNAESRMQMLNMKNLELTCPS